MMTDGIWNGADGSPSQTLRPDHSSFNLPDNESFSGSRAPYSDATTNTLADLAMHYWATDLNPGLDNEIKPYTRFSNANADTQYWDPRNNPSDWQNMTNYMVGLGLSSALNDPDIPGLTTHLKAASLPCPQALKTGRQLAAAVPTTCMICGMRQSIRAVNFSVPTARANWSLHLMTSSTASQNALQRPVSRGFRHQ
ncbi:hypothetical protein ULF88_15510 [Halopseudomonas pachastrellae]|nr:hypothetical protein [Halopseudomonas pachastrellae]